MNKLKFLTIIVILASSLFITSILIVVLNHMKDSGKGPEKIPAIVVEEIHTSGKDGAGQSKIYKIHNTRYRLIDENLKWKKSLYEEKNYEAITQLVTHMLLNNDEAGSYKLYKFYSSLTEIENENEPDIMRNVLNEWCRTDQSDHIPWLMRGVFYYGYAWRVRGGGYAHTVSAGTMEKFHSILKLSRKDLLKAMLLNPEDPNSYCYLIAVAKGLSFSYEEVEKYFKQGTSICPWHFGLYFQKLLYLKPKWHGTLEQMLRFANSCLSLSGQYLYLGFVWVNAYEEVHNHTPDDENILGSDKIWKETKRLYSDFFSRYPDEIHRRFFFAYHAYKAGKYDDAIEQFELIGDRWTGLTCWESLEKYHKARAKTYILKGYELMREKKLYDISRDFFNKSITILPTAEGHYYLGLANWYAGSSIADINYLTKAEKDLAKAHEMDPGNSEYKEQLKRLRKFLKRRL